jgi:vitamin B12 transporter
VLASNTVLRSSWSQGFKAPTLYQLYSPFFNLALVPEESQGWDAGVEQRLLGNHATMSVTYFSRDTRNQIDFVSCSVSIPACAQPGHSSFGVYTNTARTRATGVELQASLNPTPQWQLTANYTDMKALNRTAGNANFGRRLARRPDTSLNLSVGYTWAEKLNTSVAFRRSGESFDNASNARRLAGYSLIDVRSSYRLNDSVEVYGRVENVGNEKYETIYQYGTVGRAAYLGVKARF